MMHHKADLEKIWADFPMDDGHPRTEYHQKSTVAKSNLVNGVGNTVDSWGCKWTLVQAGYTGEVKEPIVVDDDWEDVSNVTIPEENLTFDVDQVNASCAKVSDKFIIGGECISLFERMQYIRGTENLYMDLIDLPTKMLDFMEELHDYNCRVFEKWCQTDIDVLYISDDWGSQRSLLINPAIWRKMFKPKYQDYMNIAHKYGKVVRWHSDGYILDILPDMIEMGTDILNAQLHCMGLKNLAQFKGKVTFESAIDRQYVLPRGTVEDVRNAVREVFDNLWDNGGCLAQCEFEMGGKPENVYAVFETWNELTCGR